MTSVQPNTVGGSSQSLIDTNFIWAFPTGSATFGNMGQPPDTFTSTLPPSASLSPSSSLLSKGAHDLACGEAVPHRRYLREGVQPQELCSGLTFAAQPRAEPLTSRPGAPLARRFAVPFPFGPILIKTMGRSNRCSPGGRSPSEYSKDGDVEREPSAGAYVCFHDDCHRRFVRKTSLTNHLKAHLNVKSRSIYRTKRARLRAAAVAAEIKANRVEPNFGPGSQSLAVSGQIDCETSAIAMAPTQFAPAESCNASDVTSADMNSHKLELGQENVEASVTAFPAEMDHQFPCSARNHLSDHEPAMPLHTSALRCPESGPTATFAQAMDSPLSDCFESETPDQLDLSLDMPVGDPWVFAVSDADDIGEDDMNTSLSSDDLSSSCAAESSYALPRRDEMDDNNLSSTDIVSLGRGGSRYLSGGHFPPQTRDIPSCFMPAVTQSESATIGSPLESVFGEEITLLGQFDAFPCM
jgi:hypothetical protein